MLTYIEAYLTRGHIRLPSLLARSLLVLALAAPGLLALSPTPAQAAAQDGFAYTTPTNANPAPNGVTTDPLRALILTLSGDLMALLLFVAGVIFTISVAKGGIDAQLNTLVGSPMGVSKAQMNLIASVVTRVLTLLSPLLVNAIFSALASTINTANITVPSPMVNLVPGS